MGLPGKATDPAHWLHMDFHDDAFNVVLSWRHWLAIPLPSLFLRQLVGIPRGIFVIHIGKFFDGHLQILRDRQRSFSFTP